MSYYSYKSVAESMRPQRKQQEFTTLCDPSTPYNNLISLDAIERCSLKKDFKPATNVKEKRPLFERHYNLRRRYVKYGWQPVYGMKRPNHFLSWYFDCATAKKDRLQRTKDGEPIKIVGTIEVRFAEMEGRELPELKEQHYKFLVVENLAYDVVYSFETMLELGLAEK